MRNKIPTRKAGPEIISDQINIYHSKLGFIANKTLYNNPAKIKTIPPTISYFHEIIKKINKINEGILCINKLMIICQTVSPGSKISNENIIKKRIKIIPKILGVQYINLLIFFFIF